MITALCILIWLVVTLLWYKVIKALIERTGRPELFAIGAICYFWTFAGVLFFVVDHALGFVGYKVGFVYYYLMEKMFPFAVDGNYLKSILFYASFFAALASVLWFYKSRLQGNKGEGSLSFSHVRLLFLVIIFIAISLFAAQEAILRGLNGEMSFYLAKLELPSLYSKVFEFSNELLTMALMMGAAVLLTQGHPKAWFVGRSSALIQVGYGSVGLIAVSYLTLMGDRNALFAGLIWSALYIFIIEGRGAIKKVGILIGAFMLVLLPGSMIRGMVFNAPTPVLEEGPFVLEQIAHVPRRPETPAAKLASSFLSNEMFAAHFSMYGCLRMDVPVDPAISLYYFKDRLSGNSAEARTVYEHYTSAAGLREGQGYTIHHATAWYLNMGWLGGVVGGAVLGLFFVLCFSSSRLLGNSYLSDLALVVPISAASYFPGLMRSGPEAYKAILLEGIGIPIFVLFVVTFMIRSGSNTKT